MHKFIIALAACAGLATSQNITIEFFWPNAAVYKAPAVTVQSANASATVLEIACPPSQTSSCEWGQVMNYTIFNSSIYEATMTNASYTVTRTCESMAPDDVNCYAEGQDLARTMMFAAQEHWSAEIGHMVVATVDSGAEKLEASSTGAASSSIRSPAAGSSAAPTASSTNQAQATGAAGEIRVQYAVVLLCAVTAALYA